MPSHGRGKGWFGRKGVVFQKKSIKINVSRNCIELIAVIFIHSTSMFCLLAPIHKSLGLEDKGNR